MTVLLPVVESIRRQLSLHLLVPLIGAALFEVAVVVPILGLSGRYVALLGEWAPQAAGGACFTAGGPMCAAMWWPSEEAVEEVYVIPTQWFERCQHPQKSLHHSRLHSERTLACPNQSQARPSFQSAQNARGL